MNNEPVAWTDGKGNYFDKNSFFPVDDFIPLYTHPVKEQDEQFKKGFEAGKEEGWKAHKFHHLVKELSRMDVYELAIESGFMLSTQYGEAEHKLMPVSDGDTLVKLANAILKKASEK